MGEGVSLVHRLAPLLHSEKESGETHIQIWFCVPRSGMANQITQLQNSAYVTSFILKDCDANLKGPREGKSISRSRVTF